MMPTGSFETQSNVLVTAPPDGPTGPACVPGHDEALYVTHVGKESNRLEGWRLGLVHDPDEVYTEYANPAREPWQTLVVPVLKRMNRAQLAERVRLSERAVAAIRNGHTVPRAAHREALSRAAGEFAREQLRAAGTPVPTGDLEACAAVLSPRHVGLRAQ
jgi:hypothetical protein